MKDRMEATDKTYAKYLTNEQILKFLFVTVGIVASDRNYYFDCWAVTSDCTMTSS